MRVGFNLPQIGAGANPALFVQAAQRAEALGYDTLWVWERLLQPVSPQTPYPGTSDGGFPDAFRHAWDPLGLLTFVAASTHRIGLGTSVLDLPYYNPTMLARALTTLDILSGGRLRVGFGVGWSKDELDAVGASLAERAERADEFLRLLTEIWTTDPVEFHGKYYRLPRSIIGLKPVQKPHPPVYLATYVPAGLRRAATLADGWNPVGLPVDAMTQMTSQLRDMARQAGRDATALEIVVRANFYLTPRPLAQDRAIFAGSIEQIQEDIVGVRALGATELFFDPTTTMLSAATASAEVYLDLMERMRRLV